MLSNQTFYVEGRELRALNGTDLKVYILVSNSPKALTCKEVATELGMNRDVVWLALLRLVERCYLRRTDDRRYAVSVFPYIPLKNHLPQSRP